MADFGEWLKKNKIKNLKMPFDGGVADVELDVVSVRALGEWAWEESGWVIEESYKIWKEEEYDCTLFEFIENQIQCTYWTHQKMYDIILACLGRCEIEKRLKELKK